MRHMSKSCNFKLYGGGGGVVGQNLHPAITRAHALPFPSYFLNHLLKASAQRGQEEMSRETVILEIRTVWCKEWRTCQRALKSHLSPHA